jgi:hypothetical protein
MSKVFATGGCQCGAVRYVATQAPVRAEFCHCRMCQKAVGNVFAAYADFKRDAVQFSGDLSHYPSSDMAQRGFCAKCGTPLTFDGHDDPTIAITIGSLDDPNLIPNQGHCGIQSKVEWLLLNDGLPQRRTGEAFKQ